MCLLRVLGEVLFRLKLYLLGIRFYEQNTQLPQQPIREAEFYLSPRHRIRFKFYRIDCIDIIMKRGKLVGEPYPSYAVQANMDETFPDDVRAYSGRSFFFNGRANGFRPSETLTIELILDVYMDFLRTSLEKHETK